VDYLYRYYNLYGNGGFKRMLNEGFFLRECVTSIICLQLQLWGTTCIYTGSVPSITGISGNDWTDQITGAHVYCTDDSTVQSVGTSTASDGQMSPAICWSVRLQMNCAWLLNSSRA